MEEDDTSCKRTYGSLCKYHWRGIILFFIPLILLPLIIPSYERPFRCLYIFAIMSIFWMTDTVPIQITGLLPIVMMPLMGILHTNDACKSYLTPPLAIFLGCVIAGLAVEFSKLHVRIALGLLTLIGCSPKRLLLGLILTTGMASMVIQNTAVTAFMLPITKAVLDELEGGGLSMKEEKKPQQEEEDREASTVASGFYLAVCYAATIGGCATLIGSATNVAFMGIYEIAFPNTTDYVTFDAFMVYNLPWVIIALFLLYLALLISNFGLFTPQSASGAALSSFAKSSKDLGAAVKQKFEDIGSMSLQEIQISILFILMLVLLIFESPGIFDGWADVIQKKRYIIDATPIIAIVIMLFYLPVHYAYFKYCCGNAPFTKTLSPLLSWKYVNTNFPWGIIFALGGGYALTKGFLESGLSLKMQDAFKGLDSLPLPVLKIVSVLFGALVTTSCPNVAAVAIVGPIIGEVARSVKTHPLNLMFPATLGCSVAFLLPISTPGNGLVAKYANVSVKKMLLTGIAPTIICIILISITCLSLHSLIYPATKDFPDVFTLHKK